MAPPSGNTCRYVKNGNQLCRNEIEQIRHKLSIFATQANLLIDCSKGLLSRLSGDFRDERSKRPSRLITFFDGSFKDL
jgi:hypothetical protein